MPGRKRGILMFATALVTAGGVMFGCSLLRDRVRLPEPAPDPLAGWVEVTLPVRWTPEYHRLVDLIRNSDRVCVVSQEGGRVGVQVEREPIAPGPTPPFRLDIEEARLLARSEKVATQVADGWLVGYDAGEWGGAVWWFSADGNTRRQVSDHQVHQFAHTQNGLYAVEGLNHLGRDRGHVLRLVMREGSWRVEEFAKLPGDGRAMAADADGSLVVATSQGVVRVIADGRVMIIAQIDPLYSDPNSIRLAGGQVYVGMREAVAVVELQTGQARLLVPPDSPLVAK